MRLAMPLALTLAAMIWAGTVSFAQNASSLVVYGGMHQTLAKGEHQARVRLADLLEERHFYGVGAVEGLRGEITILDSTVYVTAVTPTAELESVDGLATAATLLVGQVVPGWSVVPIAEDVTMERFDDVIRDAATAQGVEMSTPFMFVIEGELTDVRLHVINGACPMHARMKKLDIAEDKKPYEGEFERIQGTVVGVYAPDAVGTLTHPATSTHAHLIYVDETTGGHFTGHLEQVGIAAGATVKVPTATASGGPGENR